SLVGLLTGRWSVGGVEALAPTDQTDRYALTFQITAVLFLAFALPAFFLIRERARPGRHLSLASAGAAVRQVRETIRSSRRYPGLVRPPAGRALYTDADNTAIAFLGIHATPEAGFTAADAGRAP